MHEAFEALRVGAGLLSHKVETLSSKAALKVVSKLDKLKIWSFVEKIN